MDKISDRDRTKIRMAVADKLVDKVCDALIEGKPLTGNLRETLGNTMTNVLNEPENKSKITQTIFQSVDSALKMPLQGPLLLFSLVNNNQSYSYIQNYITMIFSKVYNENDTIKLFNKRLYDQLSEPPYESWFSQISQQGGKKRKTKRKTKRSKKKLSKRNKTKHIRKQRGGMAMPAGVAGMAKGFVEKNKDTLEKVAKETVEETKGNLEKMAKDTVTNDNKDDPKPEPEKEKDRKDMSFAERVKDDYAKGKEKMSKLSTKLETDLGANGINMPSMPGMPSFGLGKKMPEMTGGEIDQTADDLIVKFGSSLIENITTDIPTISPQILQRMLNASYIHAIKNGDQLVDSANNTLANTIKSTPLLMDIFPVILVQALYNSGKYVMESLAQTFQQQKKDARDKGKDDDFTFNPNDPNFVIIFMGKLKENISERINMG
jgi:hypothetical protein